MARSSERFVSGAVLSAKEHASLFVALNLQAHSNAASGKSWAIPRMLLSAMTAARLAEPRSGQMGVSVVHAPCVRSRTWLHVL